MRKKRTKVPNGRPKPKKKTASKSPWHKYRAVAPKVPAGGLERGAFDVVTPEAEIILGDEIEIGGLEGPDEIPEGIEDLEPPEASDE
jgi:hypothetical protein